uniref:Uncharacterized protein n=1 Tax=Cacopsylla melanoneura TaxID=428564 RepID=A0A8D8VY71_9HEMI
MKYTDYIKNKNNQSHQVRWSISKLKIFTLPTPNKYHTPNKYLTFRLTIKKKSESRLTLFYLMIRKVSVVSVQDLHCFALYSEKCPKPTVFHLILERFSLCQR